MTTTCEGVHFERQDWNSSKFGNGASKKTDPNTEKCKGINLKRQIKCTWKGWKTMYLGEIFQKDYIQDTRLKTNKNKQTKNW